LHPHRSLAASQPTVRFPFVSDRLFPYRLGMQSPKGIRLSLTRRSLSRFARAMMPAFEVAPCHQLMIDYLAELLSGKIKRLAIINPAEARKDDARERDGASVRIGQESNRDNHHCLVWLGVIRDLGPARPKHSE